MSRRTNRCSRKSGRTTSGKQLFPARDRGAGTGTLLRAIKVHQGSIERSSELYRGSSRAAPCARATAVNGRRSGVADAGVVEGGWRTRSAKPTSTAEGEASHGQRSEATHGSRSREGRCLGGPQRRRSDAGARGRRRGDAGAPGPAGVRDG